MVTADKLTEWIKALEAGINNRDEEALEELSVDMEEELSVLYAEDAEARVDENGGDDEEW